MQNATRSQMKMLLTRIGENSMMGVTGDIQQSDINENGLRDFLGRIPRNRTYLSIQHIKLNKDDIKREDVIQDVFEIYDLKTSEYPYNTLL